MSAITILQSNFTYEEELKKSLTAATGYTLISDRDLLDELAGRFDLEREKAERVLFGRESVFNSFTREKERVISCLKLLVAEKIAAGNVLLCGLSSLLTLNSVPEVSHILRIAISGEKSGRIRRGTSEGIDERRAAKLIADYDKKEADFARYLGIDTPHSSKLYDIRIKACDKNGEEISRTILEQYRRPAVLPTESSKRAAADFLLSAQIEQKLAEKGYIAKVICGEEITIKVNQSSFNFNRLEENICTIAGEISGVKESGKEISVIASAEVAVSILSDQEFTPPPKVLLVDDEKEFVQTLSERLVTRQYGSYPVFAGEEALSCLESETPDVMVLDLKMPGMQGIEVLEKVKKERPEIEVIILTGHGSEEDRTVCMQQGAFAYLRKPVDIKELTKVIDEAYAKIAKQRLAEI